MRRLSILGAIGLLLISASMVSAASGTRVWQAKVQVGAASGGASLALSANGKAASVAVKLYHVTPATKVTVALYDGACLSSTQPPLTLIASRLTFKTPSAGPAVHRFWLSPGELGTLRTDIAASNHVFSVFITATGTATATACINLTSR
jgi:hypothetical protein